MKRITTLIALMLFSLSLYAHGGGREVKGTILKTSKTSVQIKSTTGKVEAFNFTTRTKFMKGKASAKAADMRVGSRVIVHLAKDGDVLEVQIPSGKTATERIGTLQGRIVGRDSAKNELEVAHYDVKGIMAAMTMAYHVHDAKVSALPKNGTRITAKLHADGGRYWLSDVRTAQ